MLPAIFYSTAIPQSHSLVRSIRRVRSNPLAPIGIRVHAFSDIGHVHHHQTDKHISLTMADPEDWAIDSNEALELSLLGPPALEPLTFHADYTYPIFGEAETIYGYKGLAINLSFARWDMRQFLKVTWDQKINPTFGIEAEDITDTMKEYLSDDVFYDENDFQMYLANPSFKPPGDAIDSYTLNSNTYTVYKSTLEDPDTVTLLHRLQIFVLLFVEGGSYIEATDDRWQIYLLYEKTPSDEVPTIAGYATCYPYFHQNTAKSTPSTDNTFYDTIFKSPPSGFGQTNCRLRLSQFIILPPFQRAGHGGNFYDIICSHARANPYVKELIIEDPSDAFEDLRDRRDLQFLEGQGVFNGIEAPVPRQWVEDTRKQVKMPLRQFLRVLEMSLLRNINPHEDSEQYRNWRLQVKQRLYNHNIDALSQLAKAERIDKLQQTFKSVEDDYLRILKIGSNGVNDNGVETEEDEDLEEEDADDRPTKRTRFQ